MSDRIAPTIARQPHGHLPHLRGRVALVFMAITIGACLVAAALLLSRAFDERRAIGDRALDVAKALSFGFDQEVAAVNYLLKGVSKSPALLSGDIKAFYDQLKQTPVPDGSWLILWDRERQIANTLRPFGSPLPRIVDFPNYQEQLDRIRDRRWTVSGRMMAPMKGNIIVALSLRLDGPGDQMSGHITIILTGERLGAILDDVTVPPTWMKGLYDRKLQPIVLERDNRKSADIPVPAMLSTRLADIGQESAVEGKIEAMDDHGLPVLIAFRRSGSTNWTTVIMVPRSDLDAPIVTAVRRISGPAALLLLAGATAAWFMARQMERPLRTLSAQVTGAKRQVSELSGQLLALQEEERQRIARELHDSTAQHLVAANLGLASLEGAVAQIPAARKGLAEIGNLQTEALRELRIFTYLLHPPNLENDGLQATLQDFAEGFAGRTSLIARIRIPKEVDDLPPELQRAMLRVVQEALTNVHRHAGASHVSVVARIGAGRLVMRIRDDGSGMGDRDRPGEPVRLGVGIAGMRARLEQFGGSLKIKSGSGGTAIIAIVPVPVTRLVPFSARRMPASWLRQAAKTNGRART